MIDQLRRIGKSPSFETSTLYDPGLIHTLDKSPSKLRILDKEPSSLSNLDLNNQEDQQLRLGQTESSRQWVRVSRNTSNASQKDFNKDTLYKIQSGAGTVRS